MIKEELNYFLNKPITVITNSINRNFNEMQSIDYFTGICEKITDYGLFTIHPITGCKNFIFFNLIIGIFEEQQVTEEHIKEEENNKKIFKNDQLDIDGLSELISSKNQDRPQIR